MSLLTTPPTPQHPVPVTDPGTVSSPSPLTPAAYLVNVDVEEVLLMVHSLDESLQLANGPAMHNQHVGDAHRLAGGHLLQPALVPLDHRADLACVGREGAVSRPQPCHPAPYHPQLLINQGDLSKVGDSREELGLKQTPSAQPKLAAVPGHGGTCSPLH